jgi:hypothetical protein
MRSPLSLPPAAQPAGACLELDEPVTIRDHVASAVPQRDTGRPDLPVIGPDDSPRRVARRLV